MTKYRDAAARRSVSKQKEVHAIWRGIGCLMILIVPVVSYILAEITVNEAVRGGWALPYQLMGSPVIPNLLWTAAPGLAPLFAFVQEQNNLYAVVGFAIVYIVILGAVISLGYSVVYRLVGPPRYGPLDVPQPKVSVKSYKR